MVVLSLLLAGISAGLTFLAVRYAEARPRSGYLALALVVLLTSFYFGQAMGGFWSGVYTLISAFILVCCVLPWIDLLARRRNAG